MALECSKQSNTMSQQVRKILGTEQISEEESLLLQAMKEQLHTEKQKSEKHSASVTETDFMETLYQEMGVDLKPNTVHS